RRPPRRTPPRLPRSGPGRRGAVAGPRRHPAGGRPPRAGAEHPRRTRNDVDPARVRTPVGARGARPPRVVGAVRPRAPGRRRPGRPRPRLRARAARVRRGQSGCREKTEETAPVAARDRNCRGGAAGGGRPPRATITPRTNPREAQRRRPVLVLTRKPSE